MSSTEAVRLIAKLTALLPYVSEERRQKFRRVLQRLRDQGPHGSAFGVRFSGGASRLGGMSPRAGFGASFSAEVGES